MKSFALLSAIHQLVRPDGGAVQVGDTTAVVSVSLLSLGVTSVSVSVAVAEFEMEPASAAACVGITEIVRAALVWKGTLPTLQVTVPLELAHPDDAVTKVTFAGS